MLEYIIVFILFVLVSLGDECFEFNSYFSCLFSSGDDSFVISGFFFLLILV